MINPKWVSTTIFSSPSGSPCSAVALPISSRPVAMAPSFSLLRRPTMPGDVERVTFRPDLRFANVELQQGRLLLPAEFNEQSAIQHHFLRTFIVDMAGPRWRAGTGFTITTDAATALRLHIEKGRYYIDGILCENRITRAFESQPFAPTPDDPSKLTTEAAVYLDCWERHVTWLNYPSLRDPALGGADSATRVQIAWQVRLLLKDGVSA